MQSSRGARALMGWFMVLSFALQGCSSRNEEPQAPAVQQLVQTKAKGREFLLRLDSSAFSVPHLLQVGLIQQEMIPQFNGGRSRIVKFVEQGNQVFMFESSEGNLVTSSLEQSLLLASFPIVERESGAVLIDWAEGMGRIFVASDWTGQDFAGSDFVSGYETVKVTNTLIERPIEYVQNTAVFTQTAQVELSNPFSGDSQVALKVRYFLRPYQANPNFQPTVSRDFKTFGFFEVAPKIKNSGFTVSYATKFDLSKGPIKFAISADTPAEYRDAVRDGILYWNSVIPNMVEAVEAPPGVQAPDLNYNMVQWVNWDAAGMAYADAMSDPLTGEIKHAQVYMTSVFAVGGRARAIRLLRKLQSQEAKGAQKVVGLKGLSGRGLCSSDYTKKFVTSLEKALQHGADDATLLRLSADYVREVVAHEIGHTLGLRHNFSGNLGTSYAYTDRTKLFEEYVKSDKVPAGLIPSSSVMEYNEYEEGVLMGAQMRQGAIAYPYDKAAVLNLYQNVKPSSILDVPVFCTDSMADKVLDCTRFDSGRTFFEAAQTQSQEVLNGLARSIIDGFIRQSKEVLDPELAIEVKAVKLDPQGFVDGYNRDRAKVLSSLKDGQIWEVRRQFPVIDELNKEDVSVAEREFAAKSIEALGGLDAVYLGLPADWESQQKATLASLLALPQYRQGKNALGQAWVLTDDEVSWIQSRGERMITKVAEIIRNSDLSALNSLSGLPENDYQDEIASFLNNWVEEYVFSVDEAAATSLSVTTKDGKAVNVKLLKFTYPQNLRKTAAGLLSASKFKGQDVVTSLKKANKDAFLKLLNEAVGARDQYDTEKLPAEMKKWLVEQQEIESAL